MDIVSHALIGAAISSATHQTAATTRWLILYSAFPDLVQIPLYVLIGFKKKRLLCIPKDSDWHNAPISDTQRKILYDFPHSLIFVFLVGLPFATFLRLPLIVLAGYGIHILIDTLTHSGEWSIKPFYPLGKRISGFTNAWGWPWKYLIASWTILGALAILLNISRL